MEKLTGVQLAQKIKAYAMANPAAIKNDGIVRDELVKFVGQPISIDAIGSTMQNYILPLGFMTKSSVPGEHWLIEVALTAMNQVANDIFDSGAPWRMVMAGKRAEAEKADGCIKLLINEITPHEKAWKKVYGSCPQSDTGRDRKSREWAIQEFGVCQITGEPPYDEIGRDRGCDGCHIVGVDLMMRNGFNSLNSPYNLRLLRVDLHRKNDSGVNLAKNDPNLKTPEKYILPHMWADELRERLEAVELKAKG